MAKLAERVESIQIPQEDQDQVADEAIEATQTEAADQDEAPPAGEKEEKGNGDGS